MGHAIASRSLWLSTVSPAQVVHKKRVVFLGTPQIAAEVLDKLISAAQAGSAMFEIAAVVTQPPMPRGRGNKVQPSPVAQLAMERSFPASSILWPQKPGEDNFLTVLKDFHPDLCITAAYGNYLPSKFLKIPTYGTHLLLKELPSILDGSSAQTAQEQDHTKATSAPKVTVDESWLDFSAHASVLHNKVRAFAEWPGTKARFQVIDPATGKEQTMDLKIVTTKPLLCMPGEAGTVRVEGLSLSIHCGNSSSLEILELQPSGKRPMSGRDFLNGLKNQMLRIVPLDSSA